MPTWGRNTLLVVTVAGACAVAMVLVVPPAGVDTVRPVTVRVRIEPSRSPEPAETALDPARFAPGACIAFSPSYKTSYKSNGNAGRTVFLDAGHGGLDPGALGATEDGTTIQEKDLTLPVVLDATKLLREDGYRVVVSRITDTGVTLPDPGEVAAGALTIDGKRADEEARIACANLSGAAALVSVHFDALDDPSVSGTETLYDPGRPFTPANRTLATLISDDVVAALGSGTANRGALTDVGTGGPALSDAGAEYDHLDLLGPVDPGYLPVASAMPGALTEPLFITDPAEGSIAASRSGQEAIATGIEHAVKTFLAQTAP